MVVEGNLSGESEKEDAFDTFSKFNPTLRACEGFMNSSDESFQIQAARAREFASGEGRRPELSLPAHGIIARRGIRKSNQLLFGQATRESRQSWQEP